MKKTLSTNSFKLALLLCLGVASSSTWAAKANASAKTFNEIWAPMCGEMVKGILGSQDSLQLVVKNDPKVVTKVCACVDTRMRQNDYLAKLFTQKPEALQKQFSKKGFEPYFTGKLIAYTFACISPELDLATETIKPEE